MFKEGRIKTLWKDYLELKNIEVEEFNEQYWYDRLLLVLIMAYDTVVIIP